jgi:peptidoglycan/LPS O-acetylase OafA/YrhL
MWQNLLHVQNYFGTPRIHTWSLAVEEHFYIGVALLLGLIFASRRAKNYLRLLPPLIIATILGLAVLRQGAFLRDGPTQMNLYATHLRFDGLLIGMLLAYWTHFHQGKIARFTRCPFMLIFAGAALAAPVLVLTPEANALAAGLGLTSLYIGFALILLGWINLPKAHAWTTRWFAAGAAALLGQIGFYSYSIYLWHVDLAQTPISKIVGRMTAAHVPSGIVWVGATATYVLMAIFAGMILSRLLEIPMLAIRDRLVPRGASAVSLPEKITASNPETVLEAPHTTADRDFERDVREPAVHPTIVLAGAEQVQPSARYHRTLPS